MNNALLWNGSASSAVNLNPVQLEAIVQSRAFSTNSAHQVGVGFTEGGVSHALLWTGTAASAIDLHLLLPSTFTASTADTIDAQGNIFGSARDINGNLHAVKWSPMLPGDFNGNGVVDAADYIVWRDTLGQTGAGLAADGSGNGVVDSADYQVWRSHFGQSTGGGSSSRVAAVPEPATSVLLMSASGVCLRRHRAAQQVSRTH